MEAEAEWAQCCVWYSKGPVADPPPATPTAAAGSAIASDARTMLTCLMLIAASFGSLAVVAHAFVASRIRSNRSAPGAAGSPARGVPKALKSSAPPPGRQRRASTQNFGYRGEAR